MTTARCVSTRSNWACSLSDPGDFLQRLFVWCPDPRTRCLLLRTPGLQAASSKDALDLGGLCSCRLLCLVQACLKHVDNLYSITALSWKPDGSKLCVGNMTGSVDVYDACLKVCLQCACAGVRAHVHAHLCMCGHWSLLIHKLCICRVMSVPCRGAKSLSGR